MFLAINVGQGDAFYLERGGISVLVDGGRSRKKFPKRFREATGASYVDVVVCTHNDADHAAGLLGFLAHPKCGFGEIWLPAWWTRRALDLLAAPEVFVFELVQGIKALPDEPLSSIEGYGERWAGESGWARARGIDRDGMRERLDGNERREWAEVGPRDESDDFDSRLRAALADIRGHRRSRHPCSVLEALGTWSRSTWSLEGKRWQLFQTGMAAAQRIAELASLAYLRGRRVRWFEYDPSVTAPPRDRLPLVPLNAYETLPRPVAPDEVSAILYLALSTANRESLAFLAEERPGAPAVLFSADTDLDFDYPIPWTEGMIVTTPHHGSEANVAAYDRYCGPENTGVSALWVRSDGNFRKRPAAWYRGAQEKKFCTFCRVRTHQAVPRPGVSLTRAQDLVFDAQGTHWSPRLAGMTCVCT